MYYIEYFTKKPGVKPADFHRTVRATFEYWETKAGAPNVADVADMVASGLYETFGQEHP